MKRYLLSLLALHLLPAAAQELPDREPLYIVNGEERTEIQSIPPDDIERVEMLPADEETVARYGQRASNAVFLATDRLMLVSLRYDTPARFAEADSFSDYIADRVRWDETDPTARVVLRYTITETGRAEVDQELESTDNRLKRRVLKALAEAPAWTPATKNGSPIASQGILRIQLPKGRRMPRQVELIIR